MENIILTDNIFFDHPTSIALGFFDGLHLGHQQLIKHMMQIASEKSLESCVVTFDIHPLSLAFPKYAPKLISSNKEKTIILKNMNVDKFVLLPFTEELMNYDPESFIKDILVERLKVNHVVVGFNYNFGYKGKGTAQLLKTLGSEYGFETSIVNPYEIDNQVVSSTFIRNLITGGKVDVAEKYLGRKFTLTGPVIRGKGLGREFNIPTANIRIDKSRITPEPGVYYTHVIYENKEYYGLTNVGFNPTFENHPFSIETYIYDFHQDIYDKEITIIFYKKIRKEKKFKTLEDLIKQIENDIQSIRKKYISIEK